MIWQAECADEIAADLKLWVKDPGSTCAKLKEKGMPFTVKICSVQRDNASAMMGWKGPAWRRTVILLLQDQPWMLAQTWIPDHPNCRALIEKLHQSTPIGEWLYRDIYRFKRGAFKFTSDKILNSWVEAYDVARPIVARRSCFNRQTADDTLGLIEVFLQHRQWEMVCD